MKNIVPLILLALVAFLGCNRDHVQSARIEKTAPVPPTPAGEAAQALQWTLPQGWTTAQAGGMRYATLKPPVPGTAEVSVVRLAGSAGGELANVNRWRAQLGLPPIEETALTRQTVNTKAGSVAVFEFAHAGNRMVVGLLATSDGNTWFLKLMGEDAPVTQVKPDFMKLLGTLR